MDERAYLERIGAAPDAGLAELHRAHVRSVPFENYDIQLGVPLSLDVDDLADKIVRRRRGGFCYELNGLFAALLRARGHDVTMLSAFSVDDAGHRGADFEHMRLAVATPDGPWLADVGQGARWVDPVPFRPGEYGDVRVERDGELWWTSAPSREGWQRDWSFTEEPRELLDFLPRCRYQEHDPESHFVRQREASLAVDGGRIAIVDGTLRETGQPDRVLTRAQEREVLAERFGIRFAGEWRDLQP